MRGRRDGGKQKKGEMKSEEKQKIKKGTNEIVQQRNSNNNIPTKL